MILTQIGLRLRLTQTGGGCLGSIVLGLESRLADEFASQQISVTLLFCLRRGGITLSRRQLCLGRRRTQRQIIRIKPRQWLPRLDLRSGINQTGCNLAANPEGQIKLMPRPNLARVAATPRRLSHHLMNKHTTLHGRRRRCRLASGEQ